MITILAAWDWAQRPAGVLTLPSRSRPRLMENLGHRIAAIGRLPYLGSLCYAADLEHHGSPGSGRPADRQDSRQSNSAQRLRAVWRELRMPDPIGAAVAGLAGRLLLIDDLIDTGWTMTVAAKLARDAGATAVLPLALATTTG